MFKFIVLLIIFWFLWELKYTLFWLYLWQLKDYHIPRFIDHFRTHKGRKLIFAPLQIVKIVLLASFFIAGSLGEYIFYLLLLIYIYQGVSFLIGLSKKAIKRPVPTVKILFLTAVSAAVIYVFFVRSQEQVIALLIFDILTPIIISIVVLFFQPFFVLVRNQVLSRARDKIQKTKAVSGLKVVAITGSYGKTSTKEFLATILSKKFNVLKTKDHQNTEVGVARCILDDLKPNHEIFIAEVGAYNKGKVKEVCKILEPQIGIVTGVNEQHLSLFGSMKNLVSAEGGGELAEFLVNKGLLIVNGGNKYCLDLYKKFSGNKKIYSLHNKVISSDIWADSIAIDKNKISFLAVNKSGDLAHFDVRVLGGQNIQNLLAAILVASELGMSFGEIAEACKNIFPEQAGMTITQSGSGVYVIDSSYSSNPDGVMADLEYLKIFSGKKVIVMPCLIELGQASRAIHRKIGKKIAETCDLGIITTKEFFKEIVENAQNWGEQKKNILQISDAKLIREKITAFCKPGDAILLEGRSREDIITIIKKSV